MSEREKRFRWRHFAGAVLFAVPSALADEGEPKVITVPDIPEVVRQADWVHEQQRQERKGFEDAQASLGGDPAAGGVTVEGAPPEPAAGAVTVEGAPPEPAAAPSGSVASKPGEPAPPQGNDAPAGTGQDAAALATEGGAKSTAELKKIEDPPAGEAQAPPVPDQGAEAPPADAVKTTSASASSGIEPPYELEIKATARQVWVWISADDGPQRAVSLDRGESATFRAEERYVLTVDDAGGVEVSLNGTQLPSLGGKAQAKREVVIPSPG